MANVSLEPYLFFNGNCREAMEFYKGIFGGELQIQTMAEVPADSGMTVDESRKNQVMHARLTGGLVGFMASDSQKASPKAAKIELSITGDDQEALTKAFDGLAEGGTVNMPLSKQFWGDTFGQLTDKYNIDWMVNISSSKE